MTTSLRLCQIVLASATLLCLSQRSLAATARDGALDLGIRPGSEAGGLNVRSPHCPGDVFDFRTCEGVVAGSKDFGLFQVKLPATFGDGNKSWRRDGKTWSYAWPYAQGVTVHIAVEPDGDSLKLSYTLQNTGSNALDAVQLHTCIPTTEASGFFPSPTVRNAQTNWSELYDRLHIWSEDRRFTFAATKLAASEPHLSLMRKGAAPVRWGWWVNGPETFDVPLIALTSRDGRKTVALAFEQAVWASSNTGDDRACFHLFPWFGRIEPGRSVTVHGRLYVLRGGPLEALKRFQKDFPKLTAKAPLTIQLPASRLPIFTGQLGLGETNAPDGRTLWADNRSLHRNGKPWIPVMGEFHFSRCPSNEWRDALLKMKADRVDIVANPALVLMEGSHYFYGLVANGSFTDFPGLPLVANYRNASWTCSWTEPGIRNVHTHFRTRPDIQYPYGLDMGLTNGEGTDTGPAEMKPEILDAVFQHFLKRVQEGPERPKIKTIQGLEACFAK